MYKPVLDEAHESIGTVFGRWLILEAPDNLTVTPSGIYLPPSEEDKNEMPEHAKVVSVGIAVQNSIDVGDVVVFSRYAAKTVNEKQRLLVINEEDIYFTVKIDEAKREQRPSETSDTSEQEGTEGQGEGDVRGSDGGTDQDTQTV